MKDDLVDGNVTLCVASCHCKHADPGATVVASHQCQCVGGQWHLWSQHLL